MTDKQNRKDRHEKPDETAPRSDDFLAASDVTVLMQRENSSVASAWTEYLCLTAKGKGRWRLFTGLIDPEHDSEEFHALPDGSPELKVGDLSPAREYCQHTGWAEAPGFGDAWRELERTVQPEIRIVMQAITGPVLQLNEAAEALRSDDLISFLQDAAMLANEEAASVEWRAMENPPEEED